MSNNDHYQTPFDIDQETNDPDLNAANQAWIDAEVSTDASPSQNEEISEPFVGQWHELVSRTNWEKGRIIHDWRRTLVDSGVPATAYSDEVWAQQVGGVTAPHVGRLRRVYVQFGESAASYPGLSWTHFLVAMDWDDAPLWLQGATDASWSISAMRKQRSETLGIDDDVSDAQVVTSELDEEPSIDFGKGKKTPENASPTYTQPAQGGSGSAKDWDKEPSGIASGPRGEDPDFGDQDSLQALPTTLVGTPGNLGDDAPVEGVLVQPFAGLPALPDDLADAVELLKLAIVRHKATGWGTVEVDTVRSYLSAFLILIDARSR